MRASTLLVGSAIVSSAAAAVAACSSDPEAPPSVQAAPTDGATDSDSYQADLEAGAAVTDGGWTEYVPPDAAPETVEQVTANIDGISYKLKTVTVANVGSTVAISANEGADNGASIDLQFDPKTETFTCAPASNAKIVFTTTSGVAQAYQGTGDCSITVTKLGGVGDALDGTFKGNLKRGDGMTFFGTGKFHVIRKN